MKKKIFAFALCLCTLFCSFSFAFSALDGVSLDDGLTLLRKQFSRGRGPKVDSISIDYSYYSPVKSSTDSKKYPLVVIMAGAREGAYEGKELTANEFARWSSIEYQKRFAKSGGAYILIARAPEERLLFWDSSKLIAPLKAAIDNFAEKNINVDLGRIYAMGWCLVAKGAINLAVNYPAFCAAVVVMVPPFQISDEQAKGLSALPVWLIGCKSDSYAIYDLYIKPSWEKLCKYAMNPKEKLLTTFDSAVDTTFFLNHNVWLQISHDMQYTGSGYSAMKTINANGQSINTVGGFIGILSKYGYTSYEIVVSPNGDCSCHCHSENIIIKLIWQVRVVVLFCFFPAQNERCACGAYHWRQIE